MRKTYRVFQDFIARNKEGLIDKVNDKVNNNVLAVDGGCGSIFDGNLFRVQEDPFTDEEEAVILLLARIALANAETLNLNRTQCKKLKALRGKIERITNR